LKNMDLILSEYRKWNLGRLTIATLGSHSALEICAGAKLYRSDFPTLVVAENGRHRTYAEHYRTRLDLGVVKGGKTLPVDTVGCVDRTFVVDRFKDIINGETQEDLLAHNAIFVPHRSFEVYVRDYDAIEQSFRVPMFGNRYLLRYEERESHPNQYDMLDQAGIAHPHIFIRPDDIKGVALVKVLDAPSGFRRAFFLARSPKHFWAISKRLIRTGVITEGSLETATIEEFVAGVQVNLNYFYSPLYRRLEFMGPDTRRQTNLEGFLRLPVELQREALIGKEIKFEEAGHIAVTVLESLLEKVFDLGERFVAISQSMCPPGIIGPFALQCMVTPGPPLTFVVFDVSPRMPGSPGITATPYTTYLWRKPMSMGQRIAQEIDLAVQHDRLAELVT